jgi:DNA repair protein RadC
MFTGLYDTPQERFERIGPEALTTAELIALVIQNGGTVQETVVTAEALLAQCGGVTGLGKASPFDFMAVKGIARTKAMRLSAAIELGVRAANTVAETRPQISSPADAARLLMPEMSRLEQEHLRVLLLDTRNRVLGIHEVYKGSLNVSMVRIGEVFREAIRRNCAAIIVAHNHPSGCVDASPQDVEVTRQLVEAGELLDISVLDHLILGNGWISLKERGLGFK